jgi:hypothetical protein
MLFPNPNTCILFDAFIGNFLIHLIAEKEREYASGIFNTWKQVIGSNDVRFHTVGLFQQTIERF